MRKCVCHSPAPVGTSLVSTALRWTLPSGEEVYSNNTSAILTLWPFPKGARLAPAGYKRAEAEGILRFGNRVDPKYIGAVTLRGSL